MEVTGRQPIGPHRPHDRYNEERREITEEQRVGVRQAREELVRISLQAYEERRADRKEALEVERPRTTNTDHIELSAAARVVGDPDDTERAERVARLREAFEQGTLHSQERVERAAEAILASTSEEA